VNISWVIAEGYQFDPVLDIDTIKDIGPIWGSWTTWRGCSTDNVICDNSSKVQDLIDRGFHKGCNFYIPNHIWQELKCPPGVQNYDGKFEHSMQHTDDIVALHLASNLFDIILMLGFNLVPMSTASDRHYYGHTLSVIKNHPDTQWVLVDHPVGLDKNFKDLPNLTCDTLENVLKLLAQ